MALDYSKKERVKIDMAEYVKKMIIDLPIKLDENDTAMTTANENLIYKDNRKMLSKGETKIFHTITA